eukprot:scaffold44080_cov36-Tisochrysis_lutea.AAC.4
MTAARRRAAPVPGVSTKRQQKKVVQVGTHTIPLGSAVATLRLKCRACGRSKWSQLDACTLAEHRSAPPRSMGATS